MVVCFASTFAIGTALLSCARAVDVGVLSCSAFGAEVVCLSAIVGDVVLICVALVAHEEWCKYLLLTVVRGDL